MIIYYVIVFILGSVIGSFLNVCIYRIPKEESISYPPSHCTSCGNRIKSYDLIPILSYILLKGKCRFCGEKVSLRYPIIELTTGMLYLLIFFKYGITLDYVKYILFISILIVIGMIDFDTTDVYFKTTLTGIIIAIVFLGIYAYMGITVRTYLYGGLIAGGLLSVIILLTKGGMGWGDAEICLMCGLFLGIKRSLVMLFLAFIIGSIVGLILILTKKKSRKDYIPFGPYIVMAAIICILWGQSILTWYLG